LNAFVVLKQLLSDFTPKLCPTKLFEQVTDNLHATANCSKDTEVREMLGSKCCSGCISRRHWHNRRRLDWGHCAERWGCASHGFCLCICKRNMSGCSVKRVSFIVKWVIWHCWGVWEWWTRTHLITVHDHYYHAEKCLVDILRGGDEPEHTWTGQCVNCIVMVSVFTVQS